MEPHVKSALQAIDKLANSEKYDEAWRFVEQLTTEHPCEPWIWRTRAYINTLQSNFDAAIGDLTQAIAMCGNEPDFFYTRGRLLFEEARYRDAVSDFTKVIELCDYHSSDYYRGGAHIFRADAYVRLKEFDKAKADCKHVKDDKPIWTDKLRTRADILADCVVKGS